MSSVHPIANVTALGHVDDAKKLWLMVRSSAMHKLSLGTLSVLLSMRLEYVLSVCRASIECLFRVLAAANYQRVGTTARLTRPSHTAGAREKHGT